MFASSLIVSIMMLVLGFLFIVIGLLYLTKTGPQYRKMSETKSDTYIRNFGILFTILGILLSIAGIIDIFIV